MNLCVILFLTLHIARLPGPREKLPVTKIKAKYLRAVRRMKSVTDKCHLKFLHFTYVRNMFKFYLVYFILLFKYLIPYIEDLIIFQFLLWSVMVNYLFTQWKKDKTDYSIPIIAGVAASQTEASVLTVLGTECFIWWPWFSCSSSAALSGWYKGPSLRRDFNKYSPSKLQTFACPQGL